MSTVEVAFEAGDGWPIGGLLRIPREDGAAPRPAVVTVPGSRHARDAWTQAAVALAERGLAVLQIDVRGRGASANGTRYADMGPALRRRVALDVSSALDALAAVDGVDGAALGLIVEHDTAADALTAIGDDDRVGAIAVLSARHPGRVADAVRRRRAPVYAMASVEDREGLRGSVDAYLAAPEAASRIELFHGLGIGITMASVLQFERPEQRPIEARLADWMADVLGAGRQPTEPSI
jgi:hypothetical protein